MPFHAPDGSLEVVHPDPAWTAAFTAIAGQLHALLPGCGIEHIGSTSVPGLAAKPTIDVLITYSGGTDLDDLIRRLESAGFEHRPGNFEDEDRPHLFFRAVDERGKRIHHLHVLERGAPQARDYVLFRDYLRSHSDAARRYEAKKFRLLAEVSNRGEYVDGKSGIIGHLMSEARAWGESHGTNRTSDPSTTSA